MREVAVYVRFVVSRTITRSIIVWPLWIMLHSLGLREARRTARLAEAEAREVEVLEAVVGIREQLRARPRRRLRHRPRNAGPRLRADSEDRAGN